jgi:hypothetical protein
MDFATNGRTGSMADRRQLSLMNPSEGWLPDPSGKHKLRHFDKNGPTPWVSNGGQAFEDPPTASQAPPRSSSDFTSGDHGDKTPEVVAAPTSAAQPARPIGWYRNVSDPEQTRYWDGTEWLDQPESLNGPGRRPDQSGGSTSATPGASIETGDWHADPLGRHKYRWLAAGMATHFVSDEYGRVSVDEPNETSEHDPNGADASASTLGSVSAEWYPDPANPARLRFWDGHGWTDHVIDQTPSP